MAVVIMMVRLVMNIVVHIVVYIVVYLLLNDRHWLDMNRGVPVVMYWCFVDVNTRVVLVMDEMFCVDI